MPEGVFVLRHLVGIVIAVKFKKGWVNNNVFLIFNGARCNKGGDNFLVDILRGIEWVKRLASINCGALSVKVKI